MLAHSTFYLVAGGFAVLLSKGYDIGKIPVIVFILILTLPAIVLEFAETEENEE
jgi:hypothetical protein